MVDFLIFLTVVAAYLLSVCCACVFLLKTDPWGEFANDRGFSWGFAAVWPASFILLFLIAFCEKFAWPVLRLVGVAMGGLVTVMSRSVDWAMRPRSKTQRVELPRAEVRK